MKATKGDLRREIRQLRFVGVQLSNAAWAYAQRDDISKDHRRMFKQLSNEWDAIKRAEKGGGT